MATEALTPIENQEVLPQEQSPVERQLVLHERYRGLASKPFKKEEIATLMEPIDAGDVEIRPDGLIYLPEIKYRRRLNQAFGPGAWALMPTDQFVAKDNVLMRPYALYVHGRFVSEAIGEQEYFPNNPQMTWATASEGAKSNAIMRCCKDIGIASELWDPGFIEKWKQQFAIKVFAPTRGQMKELWRRKDRQPLKGERSGGERESTGHATAADISLGPVQNNGAAMTGDRGQQSKTPRCEICHREMILIPAGRSKPDKEGKGGGREYEAFWTCPDGGEGKKHQKCTMSDADWQRTLTIAREPGTEG